MSLELDKDYFGKDYDTAVRNTKTAIRNAKADLLTRYPRATLSKFEFDPDIGKNGVAKGVDVMFMGNPMMPVNIKSSAFKRDKSIWMWLHNSKEIDRMDHSKEDVGDTGDFLRYGD